ncbi:hypothetical protein [Embleya sp. NPDC020630]|uniref:hypothetical protein n=1 Tax=Embleya sp. NPDC020630 TaxID=3363979 RepID=UPI00378C00E4
MPTPVPLDEYPVHQVPLFHSEVGSTDRNFYDRCIMHAYDRTGGVQIATGLGVYPNLGVIDAYVVVRRDGRQHAVRMSGALGPDRMRQEVGPYRIEVLEPLSSVRVVCDAPEQGITIDLTFTSPFAPLPEPRHVQRSDFKPMLDASRFVQIGDWTGTVTLDGEEITVTPRTWSGSRDRSWGIRPSGEAPPAGRPAQTAGFWWNWIPLHLGDQALMIIAQESADGHRFLTEAIRMYPIASGKAPEQLGWPEFDVRYTPGTRHPEGADIHLTDRKRNALTLRLENHGYIALNVGAGYGGDPDWGHGQWRGGDYLDGAVYEQKDPGVAKRIPFGVIDHVATARLLGPDGALIAEGLGIFEHGTFGRHDPSGFTGWDSVAS